jgi:ADP-ribosyl-[dinitrogen reductase] hydrolase
MKNPNPLMLLRIAQADAYCMATEYIRLPEHVSVYNAARSFSGYCKHPTHKLDAGMYTDDTQMSIAVAEQLLSGEPATELSFAERFVRAFVRDKREGYSRGFQSILEQVTTGAQLIEKLQPTSTKNGAAMRSVPLGVIPDIERMLEVARVQASVTHATPEGLVSSCAVAFLSHWGLYESTSFRDACDRMVVRWPQYADVFMMKWSGSVKNRTAQNGHDVGLNTVAAVCTLLREQTTLLGILRTVIEWGGDTDSVAAIAWGIASSRIHEYLPDFFEADLEKGMPYGVQFLRGLGARLMKYGQGTA